MAKKSRTKKPSKAAMNAAKALLAPADLMRAMARQLELQAQQLDLMNAALDQLVVVVKDRLPRGEPALGPVKLLTEPAPVPASSLLTESPQ